MESVSIPVGISELQSVQSDSNCRNSWLIESMIIDYLAFAFIFFLLKLLGCGTFWFSSLENKRKDGWILYSDFESGFILFFIRTKDRGRE